MALLTVVRWQAPHYSFDLISLVISGVKHFSCACWSSVCLLWRNMYLGLLPIFQLGCLFLVVELYELFVYLGN